ncbi:anti-sigma factor family protein [Novipirellula artificiosorum]|uniref:Putative zinc-finger domain-containing protein n=1 Tax=Novipirellula artificiosorum TaxID=2528016 RepID=A0A5C6D9J3_9BACT|nr:zf-HC2 domain-containing protein [Novipirellula artificiosorum]TWU32835.1 hypothetical protein Poly41_52120 [Novipirellula artificiosorum]
MSSCNQINERLSGFLDGELTQGDHQRVEVHLRSCESCREELAAMKEIKAAVSNGYVVSELDHERWEKMMNDRPARLSRGIGWTLLISGIAWILSLAIWEFAIDNDVPLHIKLPISAIWFGVLFLFLSVARQRIISYKTDKYNEVKI